MLRVFWHNGHFQYAIYAHKMSQFILHVRSAVFRFFLFKKIFLFMDALTLRFIDLTYVFTIPK